MSLNKDRNTPSRDGVEVVHPVAATKKIYVGALAVLNATGYAEPGSTATTLTAIGRAEEQVDNSSGADGALTITVRRGAFRFSNHADAVTRTEIGKSCYIVDDQTVAKTDGTGTRSVAGKVIDLDSAGVWVEVG
ncbi:MAG: hypothetical protein ACXWTY_10505 [Methylobacter sp.]